MLISVYSGPAKKYWLWKGFPMGILKMKTAHFPQRWVTWRTWIQWKCISNYTKSVLAKNKESINKMMRWNRCFCYDPRCSHIRIRFELNTRISLSCQLNTALALQNWLLHHRADPQQKNVFFINALNNTNNNRTSKLDQTGWIRQMFIFSSILLPTSQSDDSGVQKQSKTTTALCHSCYPENHPWTWNLHLPVTPMALIHPSSWIV